MTDDPEGMPSAPAKPWWRVLRAELEARADATRQELIHQFEVTKHQFDETSELIEARTGRNLIAAVLIGLALGLAMLFSLIVVKELFMIVAAAIIGFAAFELATALRGVGRRVPRVATIVAALATVPAAFYLHDLGKWFVLLGSIVLVVVWRLVELAIPRFRASAADVVADVVAGAFVQLYVPFLAGFAVLLAAKPGGEFWALAFLIVVISVDTGAYVSGMLFGKHKMAPRISPKKTWEGFAGSFVAGLIASILLAVFMLGQPWWFGLIFGTVITFTATIGDLTESLIKRDLGVKDMSSWLPGHGGFLDRLDSILPSSVVAYVIYLIATS